MATIRPRHFDINKPFIIYNSASEFTNLNNNDTGGSIGNKKQSIDTHTEIKPAIKQKIDIPITQRIKDNIIYTGLSQTEKKIKHQMGYIRIKQKENLPNLDIYELNEKDFQYFSDYKLRDNIDKKQFLQKMAEFIAFLEDDSTKNITKSWSDEMYQKILKHFSQKDKIEQKLKLINGERKNLFFDENDIIKNEEINNNNINEQNEQNGNSYTGFFSQFSKDEIQKFYIYWESQRKSLERALLRKFYPANPDDPNPQAAFRPRLQDRMRLRNKGKQSDQENIHKFQNLKREFQEQEAILKCIKAREHIKFEQTVLQSNQFMEDLFNLDENTDFKYLGKFECQGKQKFEDVKQEFMNNHSFQNQKETFDNLLSEIKSAQEEASKLLKNAAKNAQNNQEKNHYNSNNGGLHENHVLLNASKLKSQRNSDLNGENHQKQLAQKYIKISNYKNTKFKDLQSQIPPEQQDYSYEFDVANFMAALIQESKLTPADLFNPSTLNEKKGILQISKKDRKLREKEFKKQQEQLFLLKKQQEEQKQLEELKKQQIKLQKQKLQAQKQHEQKKLEKYALSKDIYRNPIKEFRMFQEQIEKDILQRKGSLTFNMYKAKSRSQFYQIYRTFDNLKYGNDSYFSQSFLQIYDQVYQQPEVGLRHKFVKTDDIIWSNAQEDYQKTIYTSNKCERFMDYLRFEADMDKENEYLGLQHVQDDLLKNVKKGIKNAFNQYKENKQKGLITNYIPKKYNKNNNNNCNNNIISVNLSPDTQDNNNNQNSTNNTDNNNFNTEQNEQIEQIDQNQGDGQDMIDNINLNFQNNNICQQSEQSDQQQQQQQPNQQSITA